MGGVLRSRNDDRHEWRQRPFIRCITAATGRSQRGTVTEPRHPCYPFADRAFVIALRP
jgi:hypothetical protein